MSVLKKAYDWVGKTLRLSDGDFWRWYFDSGSYAGKNVTAQTALQLATVWACIRLLSETVATLPLGLYEKDSAGRKQIARGHLLYGLLHDQPNAAMTAVEFWEAMMASLCLWGNAYARIDRNGQYIVALDLLNPERMNDPAADANGVMVYVYNGPQGREELDESDVFHIKGFGIDGLVGLSPISYARHTLGMAMATDESAAKMFANGMQPAGFVQVDQVLKPAQREAIKESLTEFTGSANAGRTMVLEAGMTYNALSLKPEDAQMLQTRAFSVEEICRWFRVPPFMVGHTQNSTSWGTGLEQQMIGFLTFSLRPYLARIEQAVRRCLLSPGEKAKYFAEFNLEGLLRADSAGRAAFYSQMTQNGIYTRNECRAKENEPPMPGGDVLTVQSNLLPLEQLGKTSAEKNARDALRAWLIEQETDRAA